MVGIRGQESVEGADALDETLGVVEAVDAEDERAFTRIRHRAARNPLDGIHVDTDREHSCDGVHRRRVVMPAQHVRDRAAELIMIGLGLETHDVELEQRRQQLAVLRQGSQHRQRWEGSVQEQTDPLSAPGLAQASRKQQKVVVVHPDDVIWLKQRCEFAGVAPVH